MRAASLVATLPFAALPFAPLRAQEPLDSGSVIRLQPSPSSRTWTGRLHGMAGDTLWVSSLGAPVVRGRGRMVLAPPGVARIEVSPDYDAISRRRHWLIGGAGVVFALTAMATRDRGGEFDLGSVGSAAFGFGTGVVIGLVGAEALYPRRWYAVPR